MSIIKNLTPHKVVVMSPTGDIIKTWGSPSDSTIIPRLIEKTENIGTIDGVPIVRKEWERVEGLPAPKKGIYYIVSGLIAQTLHYRNDLLVPHTARDKDGQIIGCIALAKVAGFE